MKEKYFYIDSNKARKLLSEIEKMKIIKQENDIKVYLIDEYAVLQTSRIKLRNYTTCDNELVYFDELIETIMDLHKKGVAVVPILGYIYDPDSKNGNGYIIQSRVKGEVLYDELIMNNFYVYGQKIHKSMCYSSDVNNKEYILSRTKFISEVPQTHFDRLMEDMIILLDNDCLIDFNTKSNFFYDEYIGFQFTDINSHTDNKYGLVKEKLDSKLLVSYYGFMPCHIAIGTMVLPHLALDEKTILKFKKEEVRKLIVDNKTIFDKCKKAMKKVGISDEQLAQSFEILKIFGIEN